MFLKLDSLLHNITSAGKLFQVTDAAYENERLANTVFVLGTVSSKRRHHGSSSLTGICQTDFFRVQNIDQ